MRLYPSINNTLSSFLSIKISFFEKILIFVLISFVFHRIYIPFIYIPYEKIYFLILFAISLLCIFIKSGLVNKNFFNTCKNYKFKNYIKHTANIFLNLNNKNFFIFFLLFSLFFLYILILSYVKGQFLNTTTTLISFFYCLLYAAFGILCSKQKPFSLIYICFLAFIYFLFCAKNVFEGSLIIEANYFQTIFPNTDKYQYQNINYFLGIFFIITSGLFFSDKTIIFKKKLGLIPNLQLKAKILDTDLLLEKFIIFVITSVCLLLMLTVGGRGSFLSVLAIYSIHLLIFIKNIFNKKKYLAIFLIFILCVFLFFCSFVGKHDLFLFQRLNIITDISGDPTKRLTLFNQAFLLFINSPLCGSGIGSFPEFIKNTTDLINGPSAGWYPHNFILELLCETGIIGFILFFLPFYIFFKNKSKNYKFDFYKKNIFFLFLYQFLIFMVSGGLDNIKFLIFFFFLFLVDYELPRSTETHPNSLPAPPKIA